MRTITLGVLILTLWGSASAIAQLPPEILADSYLLRAEQAIGEGDQARARAELDKIIILQKEHELDLPHEFHFRYAKAADSAGMPEQAHEAVVKYLTAAGRKGRHYVEALELMNKAQDAIEASKDPQEASTEPTPSAQPVAERKLADCKQWGKWNYFWGATVADVVACLDAGADPNAPDEIKITVLHWAARYSENPAVVQALLAAGASLEARDKSDRTPLHWAAERNKNPAVVQALLAAGASLEARDESGHTPLHRAAEHNKNPAVVQALLAAGASLEARDRSGHTPLSLAAASTKDPEIIQALVAAEASLEAQGVDKETPLHRAARYNEDPGVIQALLAAGANPNARNKKGKRPEDLTKRKENRRMLAAARKTGTQKSGGGGGLGTLIAAATVAGAGAASGASTEAILAGVEAVAAGQQASAGGSRPTAVQNPVGTAGSNAGGGSCEIPGYPRPPGGVANLGLAWCPSNVDFQVRAFALQAAGAQCAIATGSSSTPEQLQARRREISAACGRLATLGAPNCQCSPGLDGSGFSQDSSAIDREQQRRDQQAQRQQAARQSALAAKRRIEAANAAVLNSDCSCIRIEDDGEYACLDGFVVGNNSSGKPLCDIKR